MPTLCYMPIAWATHLEAGIVGVYATLLCKLKNMLEFIKINASESVR